MQDKHSALQRRGLLLVLSSPSGAGKTTLSRMLLQQCPLHLSISVTTRPPRGAEEDGVHYHFCSEAKFLALKERGAFLEWAKVHGNYYGTLKETVDRALEEGKDLLFDIDPQGMHQLKEKRPLDIVSIFILPPSRAELERRLKKRAEDAEEVIKRRLAAAQHEIEQCAGYDYVIVNEDLDTALGQICSIYQAEKTRLRRVPHIKNLIEQFLS